MKDNRIGYALRILVSLKFQISNFKFQLSIGFNVFFYLSQ